MRELRLISLWQPWAELIVWPAPDDAPHPIKRCETRGWRPADQELPVRVLVHATLSRSLEVRHAIEEFTADGYLDLRADRRPLAFGAVVGVVTIKRVFSTDNWTPQGVREGITIDPLVKNREEEARRARVFARNYFTGNYETGRWAFDLWHPIPLPSPISWKGQQGTLHFVPDALRRAVADQIGELALSLQPEAPIDD